VPIQPLLVVAGAVAPRAAVAVVVGAGVAKGAVDGEHVVGAIADKTGVGVAVGTDGAGAYVAPFFRSSRPAWWAEAASC
jgi:hypothetical protein